ncbi:unnamed protein product [Commensalibacter communis]|uniref:hypothetical protein n=1 Tax=Commensalibacter communis TaxID=2972786 RepID=UPI0022FFBD28|nr:hypothetical protein [Commensalibacter communis]CAI3943610.1 unnamed protein product [Commensalibacter communis]
MSTDYYLHIRTLNPSFEDYYIYTLSIIHKYKVREIQGMFGRYAQKRRTKGIEIIKYPNNSYEFNKDNFIEDITNCELSFTIEFYLYDLYVGLHAYSGISQKDTDNDFDYTIIGGNVRTVDVFSFLDATSSIFLDEKFIWGCFSYDHIPRLEDYYIVFLKNNMKIDLPLGLAKNIVDEDKYVNLGDFFGNGINMYVDKNYRKFLDG